MSSSELDGLRCVLRNGLEPALAPRGFIHSKDRKKWVRDTGELVHHVVIAKSLSSYKITWGIVSPGLVGAVWGLEYRPSDVSQAVVAGFLRSAIQPVEVPPLTTEALSGTPAVLAETVHHAIDALCEWMAGLPTRAAVRNYLLANRDASDPRGFIVPANLGLKLLVCAGLAILDGASVAGHLLDEAESAIGVNEVSARRIASLRAMTFNG